MASENETVMEGTEDTKTQETENQSEDTKETAESDQEKKLRISFPGDSRVLQVTVGTDLEAYGIKVHYYDYKTPPYDFESNLVNSMVSGFDNSKLGYQEVTVTWNGYSNILKVHVVAEGEVLKPSKLEVSTLARGSILPMGVPIENILGKFGNVFCYDEYGNYMGAASVDEVEVSGYDMNKKGEQKITVTVREVTEEITVNVLPMKIRITPSHDFGSDPELGIFNIPVNGNTEVSLYITLVNADNPSEVLLHLGMGWDSLLTWVPELDISKPSFRTYSIQYIDMMEDFGFQPPAEIKIRVGNPDESNEETSESNPSESNGSESNPDESSGETSESSPNESSGETSESSFDGSSNETTGNGSSSGNGETIGQTQGTDTPKTGDTKNIMAVMIVCLGSLLVLSGGIVSKKLKNKC